MGINYHVGTYDSYHKSVTMPTSTKRSTLQTHRQQEEAKKKQKGSNTHTLWLLRPHSLSELLLFAFSSWQHPAQKLIGSETASALSDRGEYANDPTKA